MSAAREPELLAKARGLLESMRSVRRDLHHHPELGMKETRTAVVIAGRLRELGLEVQSGIGGTGLVGLLRGNAPAGGPNRTVALRADIDALPMQDRKEVPYASRNPGVAHSCGHDAHTAMQLGAAELLAGERESLRGDVKLIFQPSEDTLPGGALPMIAEGVLEKPPVDAIFTVHLHSDFPEATATVKRGNASTSSTSFSMTIHGLGGHVGVPHRVVNPVLLAANLVAFTQSVLPKSAEPGEPLIFEFASIHGGTVANIVPDRIVLMGSVRAASVQKLDEVVRRFTALARGMVESAGGGMDLDFQSGYPTIYNDPELTDLWHRAAAKVVGRDRVIEHERVFTSGDDAAYFHQRVPGVYWFLGIRNEEAGFVEALHSPLFDFNEEILAVGAAVQAQAAMDYLESPGAFSAAAPLWGARGGARTGGRAAPG